MEEWKKRSRLSWLHTRGILLYFVGTVLVNNPAVEIRGGKNLECTLTFIIIFFPNNLIPTYLDRYSSKKIPGHGLNENITSRCLGYVHTPGGGGVLPYKGLMGTCGQPGYVFRDFCLKQGIDFIIFCVNQGQGMRGRAAPPPPFTLSPDNFWCRQEKPSSMWFATKEIGAAQILSVTEIAPKSPLLCLNSAVSAQKLSDIVSDHSFSLGSLSVLQQVISSLSSKVKQHVLST